MSDFLWTYIVITMLVFCALFFTVRLRGMQFRFLGEMLKSLFASTPKSRERKHISSFQAFAVSLSSRVGTGNLAGVASAIAAGGPGAVFWMWVMALLGSATAFVEATLAQLYKRRGEDSFYGGPAYYMQFGLHKRWMGILFAILITLTFGFANQIIQSNTLCDALADTAVTEFLNIDKTSVAYFSQMVFMKKIVGGVLTAMTLVIIFGGIQRISHFSAIVVPFMALGYILLSIVIVLMNITIIPEIIVLIFKSAFGLEQAFGGVVGMAVMQGVKRGLFSNEAGEGSAPNAAATATTSHPVKQGFLQAFGVFTDTLIICTCTAFMILISGKYTSEYHLDGILLTSEAIQSEVGVVGKWFLTMAIFLFAYSTIIANYFYGENNIRFVSNRKWGIQLFRIFTGGMVMTGGLITLQTAWDIVDLLMGAMTIVNLVAIFLLFPKVVRLFKDYVQQRHKGIDPVFKRETTPEIASDLDAWE